MLSQIRGLLSGMESGQAMIMVAVLGSALMGITGLAIEGGRVLVEERRMQVAADMAALVGAQDAGCATSNTTCINLARQTACDYAQRNGFGGGWNGTSGCVASGGSTVTVDIPPATCSPYNIDYDNGRTPSNSCTATSTAGHYDYVEVEIDQNLGSLPVFNVSVRPHVHAVARKGTQSPRDFAIAVLDPILPKALDISGSSTGGSCGVCVVGSIMSDSTASNSINTGGQGLAYACGGEWYTASTSETSAAGNLRSYQVGSALFSPPGCSGTQDTSVAWNWGQEKVADPYGAEGVPGASGWANCATCGSSGHYYHWTNSQGRSGGKWDDSGAGSPGSSSNNDNYELFPGQYPSGITATGGSLYLSPGVYNLGTGGLKISGSANICVFGAPICDSFSGAYIPGTTHTCGTASMDSSSSSYVLPATWYYYCSPWGTWDTSPPNGQNGAATGLPTTLAGEAPSFTNYQTPSSRKLNGVIFYSYDSSKSPATQTGGGIKITGSGVESMAFPDPCPGTGTFTSNSNQVPFQSTMGSGSSGASTATYSYSAITPMPVAVALGQSRAGVNYPSADLTVDGETACRAALNNGDSSGSIPEVWPGEFQSTTGNGTGQLLHFLFFLRDKTASIDLEGSGTQSWWGILYNPGDYATAGQCGSATSGCQVKLAGSSGGSGDLPMVMGQIVADGASVGGSSTIEVFYRPCNARTANCNLGPGSTLVQ